MAFFRKTMALFALGDEDEPFGSVPFDDSAFVQARTELAKRAAAVEPESSIVVRLIESQPKARQLEWRPRCRSQRAGLDQVLSWEARLDRLAASQDTHFFGGLLG